MDVDRQPALPTMEQVFTDRFNTLQQPAVEQRSAVGKPALR
jgi:hypothetical protein